MKQTMKAIGFTQFNSIRNKDSIFDFTTTKPIPKDHDLLIKVEAVSVNPVDIFTRRGQKSALTDPKIIGYDGYGTVVSMGDKTNLFRKGDKVFYAGSYNRPGSNAEYQLVDERIVGHAPASISPKEAVAMPLTALTAWESLFEQMSINFDETEINNQKSILIINGAGGVGSVATQLSHLAGLTVIATAGNPSSKAWVKNQGADYIIDYHEDIEKQISDIGFKQVDYVLELQNLDFYWPVISKIIAPGGFIVSTTGSGQNLNFKPLKEKMVKFGLEWMFSKSWYQTKNMISQHYILEKISSLLDKHELKSTATEFFGPINSENIRQATQRLETGHTIGKIVIEN